MTPDIVLSDVSKSFGAKRVLSNFNALFLGGKTNCLSGPSGSGKTTLAHLLLGLESQDGGTIKGLEGLRLSAVFQEDRLCPNLSAKTNVRFASGAGAEAVSEALRQVGLDEAAGQKASTLSGGQKRRVAIVRALLSPFDLLILDEPFEGLDGKTKAAVMAWTKKKIAGRTAVLITHDESEAAFLCDGSMTRLD